jgi:HK97 family phage portal protein
MTSTLGALAGAITNRTPVSYAAARTPFTLMRRRRSGGMREELESMALMGTIFAIVTKTASGTAAANWHLYRTAASGKPEDRVEVMRHPALDLWNKPNPFMTRQEFVEVSQQHIDLAGESEWLTASDPRFAYPLELWPIRPDRMEPVTDPTEYLTGWLYSDPDGRKVPLSTDEVIQLRSPNPVDPYRGLGPVQTVLMDIEGASLAAEYNRNFFSNSAEPGGIITTSEHLTEDEFNQLRDRWGQQHRGVANASRVAILEGGMTWEARSYSNRDMQFTELRSVSAENVREAFGFPKPMLGSVDDVNRANAEAGEYVFGKWLMVPRLERFKQALNTDLLPLYGQLGEGLEFDYESPVPEDQAACLAAITAKTSALAVLVSAGFDPTDAQMYLGLPVMGYTRPGAVEGLAG